MFLILKLCLLAGAVAGEKTQVPVFGPKTKGEPVFPFMEDWFSGGNRNRDSTWKTGFYVKAENISTSSVASLQLKSPPARMS